MACKPQKPAREKNSRGIALYLVVAMLAVLFSVAFGMSAVSISQMKNLQRSGDSIVAFCAAESGIERSLLESEDSSYSSSAEFDNDASYTVVGVDPGSGGCPGVANYCLKATGTYNHTQRVIMIQI